MRETKIHKLEVHVSGICIHNGKVLIAKRASNRKIYPSLWECGGGQVEAGEDFQEAVVRQFREEFGITVTPINVCGTYKIDTLDAEQRKIPGVEFACKFEGFINGKEPLISEEHTEYRWHPIDKIDEIDFIPGIADKIKMANEMLK